MIAVGLQEVDMSVMALQKVETEKHKPWLAQIMKDCEASDNPADKHCKYVLHPQNMSACLTH